jgi:hypothetical protein
VWDDDEPREEAAKKFRSSKGSWLSEELPYEIKSVLKGLDP